MLNIRKPLLNTIIFLRHNFLRSEYFVVEGNAFKLSGDLRIGIIIHELSSEVRCEFINANLHFQKVENACIFKNLLLK